MSDEPVQEDVLRAIQSLQFRLEHLARARGDSDAEMMRNIAEIQKVALEAIKSTVQMRVTLGRQYMLVLAALIMNFIGLGFIGYLVSLL